MIGDLPFTDTAPVEYTDNDGIRRRVNLPVGVTAYSEGIPISLDADRLFQHASVDFRKRLMEELWARNLIEPCDYLKPGAAELIRAALLAAVKIDALEIITLAHKECRR